MIATAGKSSIRPHHLDSSSLRMTAHSRKKSRRITLMECAATVGVSRYFCEFLAPASRIQFAPCDHWRRWRFPTFPRLARSRRSSPLVSFSYFFLIKRQRKIKYGGNRPYAMMKYRRQCFVGLLHFNTPQSPIAYTLRKPPLPAI